LMKAAQVVFYVLVCSILLYIAHYVWEENSRLRYSDTQQFVEDLRVQGPTTENSVVKPSPETIKPPVHKEEGAQEAQAGQEEFSVDLFLVDAIIKQKTFCKKWIEIGTGNAMETVWLRMSLDQRKQLISYDPIDRSHSITEALEDQVSGEILFIHDFEKLLQEIEAFKGTQVIIFRDSSAVLPTEMLELVSALSDYSLIILPKNMNASSMSGEEWPEVSVSTHWSEISDSLDSSLTVLEKRIQMESDHSFAWELYPEGISKNFIHLGETQPFDASLDWLIFLRIQKCGTKTLKTIISKEIKPGECAHGFFVSPAADNIECHLENLCSDGVPEVMAQQRNTCRMFVDHFCDWQDIFNVFPASEARPVALLRDPIFRTISEYKHVYKTHHKQWDYCPTEENGEAFSRQNFLNFLVNPKNQMGMRNRQTRMLAGCGSIQLCNEQYEDEREMLETAKRHLLQCSVVGILERFGDMVIHLNYIFGWNIEQYEIIEEKRDLMALDWDVDDEVRDMILEYNNLDYELHAFASTLFDYRHAELRNKYTGSSPFPRVVCNFSRCSVVQY